MNSTVSVGDVFTDEEGVHWEVYDISEDDVISLEVLEDQHRFTSLALLFRDYERSPE